MKFARVVFFVAGVWGLLIVTPLYFLYTPIAQQHPSLITDPQFFYSFLAVTVPWQFAFLAIGSDAARFRLLMIPSIVEKLGYVLTMLILWMNGRTPVPDALTAVPDCLLGILFVVAYLLVTKSAATSS